MNLQREQSPPTRETRADSTPLELTLESEKLTLSMLQAENSGLRRMVVELLEKNQKLREQLHGA